MQGQARCVFRKISTLTGSIYSPNSCIHSVITLFFAHQKSKTDCDADGSVQKKTQIQWKQYQKISTPAQLQDANIFRTPHATRGKILNPLKSW